MLVYILRLKLNLIISLLSKVRRKLKAKFLVLLSGYDFKMVGKNFKLNVKPYSAKNNTSSKWGSMRV
ncbi:transferase, partial [Salmonella enterica]|nr:transferase [Salmonella enterica]